MTSEIREGLFSDTHPGDQPDREVDLLARMVQTVYDARVRADQIAIVNFYVALKSKPMVLLVGERQSGKITLVQSIANVLTGSNPIQCQTMVGHAWWAERSGNISFFTGIQTRYNTTKIFALIEEAVQPENRNRLYFACLGRISPGELTGYFSKVAYQQQHGEIIHLPSSHLTSPIPFPPNLFLVGTMDALQFEWFDEELLSQTTVINWSNRKVTPSLGLSPAPEILIGGREFLVHCIRNEQAAYNKLRRIPGWQERLIRPLLEIESLMIKHTIQMPRSVISESLIYLANSWSWVGHSLFDPSPIRNLEIALDLVISQVVLPRGWESIRNSDNLRRVLIEMLDSRFHHSRAFLKGVV